ncbi:Ribosomal RNA-processing protein 7 [Arachnomyces sp. PD_36]|nr:Ribosomal RNA-processing protein 7 [Arachnomyces sp. PD_36]
MAKIPTSISGYTVLPIRLPSLPSFPEGATHYIYLQPHEPRIPEPHSARSLFLVNIPTSTTETHLRHLFGTQLASGRVEQVEFHDAPKRKSVVPNASSSHPVNKKKRKRIGAEELEGELENIELPQAWDRKLQSSGAHAVVVFVDVASMEASLKAAKRAAKKGTGIVWGEGIEDRIPALGPKRYEAHERALYPSRATLLRSVNDYMTVYARLEEARTREAAKKTQEPDEDGFITVTSGPKNNSVVREEEVKELIAKQKEKSKGLEDFYRFQMREKRKEKQGELVRRFEEDKRKVEDMKRRRGKVRPE